MLLPKQEPPDAATSETPEEERALSDAVEPRGA